MTPVPGFGKRLGWLLGCAALGAAVASAGVFFSGSQWWSLAIPAAVAAGWLFFGDPTQCDPPASAGRGKTDPHPRRYPPDRGRAPSAVDDAPAWQPDTPSSHP